MGYTIDQEEFESIDKYRLFLKAHIIEGDEFKSPALLLGVKRVEKDRPEDYGTFEYVKIRFAETIIAKLAPLVARALIAIAHENYSGSKSHWPYYTQKLVNEFIYNFKREAVDYARYLERR